MGSLVSTIREAVSGVDGQKGDIVIPVYQGGAMLDEVIVNAQQRANLRSGGRQEVEPDGIYTVFEF